MDGHRGLRGAITLSCKHVHPWLTNFQEILNLRWNHSGTRYAQFGTKLDIDYRLLGNMDETPVFFDIVPGRTVEVKGRKAV